VEIIPMTADRWAEARKMDRSNRLVNARHYGSDWTGSGQECNDGELHRWQPVSFVFESQLLDDRGRIQIRQPDISKGRCYLICLGCNSHTYVETEWAGYYLGGPGDGTAGPDPVLGSASEGFVSEDDTTTDEEPA
jgi:hypothetical protein